MPSVSLTNRAIVTVSGRDAESFLQALITTDLASLAPGEARPGALLTPQGKILFDFMASRDNGALLLETDAGQADNLLKRLTMYRLRAAVDLSLASPAHVTVAWGDDIASAGLADSRFTKAGVALRRLYTADSRGADPAEAYDALRAENGVAVSGRDFQLSDAFPHDVLMDLNGGLSFRKGCYVGQEVVSRMQHRGTARRRVVLVEAASPLPATGTVLAAGGKPVGELGTVSGAKGLAIVRTDRAGETIAKGESIFAGDVAVSLSLPGWSGLSFPQPSDEASA